MILLSSGALVRKCYINALVSTSNCYNEAHIKTKLHGEVHHLNNNQEEKRIEDNWNNSVTFILEKVSLISL